MGDSDGTVWTFVPCYERRMLCTRLWARDWVSSWRSVPGPRRRAAQGASTRGRPLCSRYWGSQGATITLDDLSPGHSPVAHLHPVDPHTSVVRDGSRLNQVLLLHLDPAGSLRATARMRLRVIVAYSACLACMQKAVMPWLWQEEGSDAEMPMSRFEVDPTEGARVVAGSAPRRLPALPLKTLMGS